MTRDEILRMAKQADVWVVGQEPYQSQLEAFAKLVAQHERDACANLCEQHGYEHYCGNVTDKLAETIRARGQA